MICSDTPRTTFLWCFWRLVYILMPLTSPWHAFIYSSQSEPSKTGLGDHQTNRNASKSVENGCKIAPMMRSRWRHHRQACDRPTQRPIRRPERTFYKQQQDARGRAWPVTSRLRNRKLWVWLTWSVPPLPGCPWRHFLLYHRPLCHQCPCSLTPCHHF